MRKGRMDSSEHLTPFFNPSFSRCEASSPDSRTSATSEGGREGTAVAPTNCTKPTSSAVNLTMMGSHANTGNSSIRMPPPSQMTLSRPPGQTSVRSSQAMVRQGQTAVRSNLTTTPLINSDSDRTQSSTQLPLSYPTPPTFNFVQCHAPMGTSHPQKLNTPAPSQVINIIKGGFSQGIFSNLTTNLNFSVQFVT